MSKLIAAAGLLAMVGMSMTASAASFYENFDALGASGGATALASDPNWDIGDDSTDGIPGLPATCDPGQGGTNADGCADNITRLYEFPAGSGNYRMFHTNWTFSGLGRGTSGIISTATYTRGNGLTCVFQASGISSVAPAGEPYPATGNNFGPWLDGSEGGPGWGDEQDSQGDVEQEVELGTSHWTGWAGAIRHVEGVPGQLYAGANAFVLNNAGGFRGIAMNTANAAEGNPYWVKSVLGDSTGGAQYACLDYTVATQTCNDAGGWTAFIDASGAAIDTRGQAADPGGVGGNATVKLGFASFKHAMFDEITVYDDTSAVPVELSGWAID